MILLLYPIPFIKLSLENSSWCMYVDVARGGLDHVRMNVIIIMMIYCSVAGYLFCLRVARVA